MDAKDREVDELFADLASNARLFDEYVKGLPEGGKAVSGEDAFGCGPFLLGLVLLLAGDLAVGWMIAGSYGLELGGALYLVAAGLTALWVSMR